MDKAKVMREQFTFNIDNYNEFKKVIDEPGGFLNSFWCGSAKCEQKVKDDTKATIRLIPFEQEAYENDCNMDYNKTRSTYAWLKYI